jgi:hypothetical protein
MRSNDDFAMKKKDNEGVRRSRVTPLTCLFVDGLNLKGKTLAEWEF